jgi:FtsX-like permease family
VFNIFENILRSTVHQVIYHRVRTAALVLQVVLAMVATTVSLTLIHGRERGLLPPELFKVTIDQKIMIGSMPARVFSGRVIKTIQERTGSLQSIAAYAATNSAEITTDGQKYNLLSTLQGTSSLPAVLKLDLVSGDLSIEYSANQHKVLLLEESVAIGIFGSAQQALGKTVLFRLPIPGSAPEPMNIRGVYRLNDADVGTFKMQAIFGARDTVRLSGLLVRAKTGETARAIEQVSLSVQGLFGDLIAQGGKILATTDTDPNFHSSNDPTVLDPTLVVFSGFGAILLAATALGVFATALASSVERERERAVKVAIGAKVNRLFAESILEMIFTTLIGTVLGLVVAWGFITAIRSNVGLYLFGRSLTLQANVLLQSVAVVVVVNIIASLYPIIVGLRVRPAVLFKEA